MSFGKSIILLNSSIDKISNILYNFLLLFSLIIELIILIVFLMLLWSLIKEIIILLSFLDIKQFIKFLHDKYIKINIKNFLLILL